LTLVRSDSKYSQVTLLDANFPELKAVNDSNVPVSIIIFPAILFVTKTPSKSDANVGFVIPVK